MAYLGYCTAEFPGAIRTAEKFEKGRGMVRTTYTVAVPRFKRW